jgi:hypothetical protein
MIAQQSSLQQSANPTITMVSRCRARRGRKARKQAQAPGDQCRHKIQEQAEVLAHLQRAQALLDLEDLRSGEAEREMAPRQDCQQERPYADWRSNRCNNYHYIYICGHRDTWQVRDAWCATCKEEGSFCRPEPVDICRKVKCRRCGERTELDKRVRRAAREREQRMRAESRIL